MTSLTRASIGFQSATQTRTSPSTCSKRLDDFRPPRLILDALGMDVNEAFARPRSGRRSLAAEGEQETARVALQGEHRMDDEADLDALLVEFAQHGIDQERHVVVDDLQDRDRLDVLGGHRTGARVEADLRRPGLAVRQQRPGVLGERRKLARLIAEKILGRRAPEQASGESRRHVVAQPGQDRAHLLDEPAPGAFVFGADQGLYGHCLHPTSSPALLSARQSVSGPRSLVGNPVLRAFASGTLTDVRGLVPCRRIDGGRCRPPSNSQTSLRVRAAPQPVWPIA